MNKREIMDAMKDRISASNIIRYSGEWVIGCKFGIVSPTDNGQWDIFITGVHNGTTITTRKLRSLISTIFSQVGTDFEELTGEAEGLALDNEEAFLNAILLGARRKRKVSHKSLIQLRKARKKAAEQR